MSDMLKPVAGSTLIAADPVSKTIDRKFQAHEGDKEKVCENFESFMIFMMMKNLEKTTNMGKKGYAEQTYMSIIYEKVGDFLAKKGIGIKEMLMRYADQENTKVFK